MEPIGITAFVLSIVGIFIPIIGYFLAGLSGIFVFFSDMKKITFSLSAAIINIVNIYILSPSLTGPIYLAKKHGEKVPQETIFGILVLIQVAAIIFIAVKKYRQKKNDL